MLAALRIAPFGRLLATYTLDEAADWLVGIALAVFVYERTGSALGVAALLMATRFGPSLVITPLAGRLGVLPLGPVLALLYLGAALVALLVAASTTGPLVLMFGLTFLTSTCAATARVLTRTAACNLLDEHGMLREGVAALTASYGAINVLGPAAAGAMTVLVGTTAGLVAAALIFTGLAVTIRSVRAPAAEHDSDTATVGAREALSLLAAGPGVAAVLLASLALLVLFSLDEPIMLAYVEQSLGGTSSHYAQLLTFWGIGLLAGTSLFAVIRRWSMLGTFVVAGTLLAGAYIVFGAAGELWAAYAAAVVGGAGNGMFWGAFTVITLEAVPAGLRTRTSGAIESLALAAPGIGYLLGGALGEVMPPSQVYLLAGALGGGVVACLGLALWLPARTPSVAQASLAPLPSATPGA